MFYKVVVKLEEVEQTFTGSTASIWREKESVVFGSIHGI